MEALRFTLNTENVDAIKLLTQYVRDDTSAGIAFDALLANPLSDPVLRTDIYRRLLHWNVGQGRLDAALVQVSGSSASEEICIEMLLLQHADPNHHHARCFIEAIVVKNVENFCVLSSRADAKVVCNVLLSHFSREEDIIHWTSLRFSHHSGRTGSDLGDVLNRCVSKFPWSCTLFAYIVKAGATATSKTIHCSLGEGKAYEDFTILSWALMTEATVGNETILDLISHKRIMGMLSALYKAASVC